MSDQFYENSYEKLFYCGGVAGGATRFIHRQLESGLEKLYFKNVLEVGGGEGFHVPYVKHYFERYHLTDISIRDLSKNAENLELNNKLTSSSMDAEHLAFKEECFDRIIFMCVLHHLNDPYKALQESLRVIKNNGLISIYLPCDPGFTYRQTRKIFLRKKIKDLNLNYSLINAKEHHKHVHGLDIFINDVFSTHKIVKKSFPFRFHVNDLNIFNVYQIRVIK